MLAQERSTGDHEAMPDSKRRRRDRAWRALGSPRRLTARRARSSLRRAMFSLRDRNGGVVGPLAEMACFAAPIN
jgi:hypothetical protein